jgi:hypothetical protein
MKTEPNNALENGGLLILVFPFVPGDVSIHGFHVQVACLWSATSTKGSPLRKRSITEFRLFDKTFRRCAFEVLPMVSQMTCGGGPRSSSKRTKSLSLVNTTASASRAARKIYAVLSFA